jgi:hypothetical protein
MAGENYTNTFGGENVNPANLSYVAYTISSNIALVWAFEAAPDDLVTADKVDINCQGLNFKVAMPPADRVTVGQDIMFGGIGVYPFIVTDNGGNTICTVPSGVEWFIYLTDNSTPNGVWRSVQFGATSSAGNAAALAGAGLRANGTVLDQNLKTTALTGNYAATAADRATVLENTGGSVTYTFPDATAAGNGWFVYVINAGTGNLVIDPFGAQTIDGSPTKTLAPTETLIVFSDGSNYHTLGYGRAIANTVTGIAINAAGAGTLVLNSAQVAAQIQDFSGTLTGNRVIQYGTGVGYWFVFNNTTGAFTFTAQAGAADPGVLVPQGAYSILRSNGTNMEVAFSGAVGTVTSVATTTDLIGGTITTTGTLGLSNTGVTAGTYGDATHTSRVQVDIKGRILVATAPAIAIPSSQITDLSAFLPTGVVMPWAPSSAPSAFWLICDGTVYPIPSYPILGPLLGNTYGGDGTTTFAVPDLRGRTIAGVDSGVGRLTATGLGVAATLAAVGGNQVASNGFHLPAIGVAVGQWFSGGGFSGSTVGAQSVNFNGTTGNPNDGGTSVTGGGGGAANVLHTHNFNVSVNTGGEALGFASFGASGGTNAYDGNTLNGVNVQPTLVMRWIIKI